VTTAGTEVRLPLRFGEQTVMVLTEDARLGERIEHYYQPFARPHDDGSSAPAGTVHAVVGDARLPEARLRSWDGRDKDSFADLPDGRVIRKDRTGVVITASGRDWTITGDLHRNFSQLLNLIAAVYGISLIDRGGAMVHASAVVRDGKALAVIGQSGMGKSSLCVRLLEHGFDFLTNDRLLLEPSNAGTTALGLPKLPRVNPGTLVVGKRTRSIIPDRDKLRYARLGTDELWQLEEKYDLDVRRTLGTGWLLSAPLGSALVLSWRRGTGDLALEPMTPAQAVEALRGAYKSFGVFDLALETRSDEAFRQAAAAVPFFRVSGPIEPTRLAAEIAAGLHGEAIPWVRRAQ
jgi:HprK-related kinase B